MYILPGFTSYQEKDNTIVVKSKIYYSEIELSDAEIKKNFMKLQKMDATHFLHP